MFYPSELGITLRLILLVGSFAVCQQAQATSMTGSHILNNAVITTGSGMMSSETLQLNVTLAGPTTLTPSVDADGDGVLDAQDAFPNDPAASVDSDGDGYPDAWNPGKTAADSTSVPPLALDAFSNDPVAAIDSDLDGSPDEWAAGATAQQIFDSALTVDAFPNDPYTQVGPSADISQYWTLLTGNEQRFYEFKDTTYFSIEDWYERSGGTVQFKGQTVQAQKDAEGFTDYFTLDANGLVKYGSLKEANHVWSFNSTVQVDHNFVAQPSGSFAGDFTPGNLITPSSLLDLYSNIGQTYKHVFARTQEDIQGNDLNGNQVRVEVTTLDFNGGAFHDLSDPAHPYYSSGYASDWASTPGMLSGLIRFDHRLTAYDATSGNTIHENQIGFLKPDAGIVLMVFDETILDAAGTVIDQFNGRNRMVAYDVGGVSTAIPGFARVQVKVEDQAGTVPTGSYVYGNVVDTYGTPLQITSFAMEDSYSGSGLFTFITYPGFDERFDIHYGADAFVEQVAPIQDIYTMSLTAVPTYVLVPSISGVVTNASGQGGPVLVGLFSDPYATVDTGLGALADPFAGNYTINGVPDGTYWLASYVDLNGNNAVTGPDVNEPVSMTPVMVTVAGGNLIDVNIVIDPVLDSDGDLIGDFWDLYPTNPNYALEPDTDGDGMADTWEIANFGNLTAATQFTDANGNGVLDWQEFVVGTNPTSGPEVIEVGDYTGDGYAEVALVRPNVAGTGYWIELHNGLSLAVMKRYQLGSAFDPVDVVAVDENGDGHLDVGVLGAGDAARGWRGMSRLRMVDMYSSVPATLSTSDYMLTQVSVDAQPTDIYATVTGVNGSGQVVAISGPDRAYFGKRFLPYAMVVLPDVDGNGEKEVAVTGLEHGTGNVVSYVRNLGSGTPVSSPAFENYRPVSMKVIPDINGNGQPELMMLGVWDATMPPAPGAVPGTVLMQVHDALTGAFINKGSYGTQYSAVDVSVLPDSDTNTAAEIAVLGANASGVVRVKVRDALTSGPSGLKESLFANNIFAPQGMTVVNTNQIATLGWDASRNFYNITIRNRAGTVIARRTFY